MQELMARHKMYSLAPRDCLKTTLFQKWQRMIAPPGIITAILQLPLMYLMLKIFCTYLVLCRIESSAKQAKEAEVVDRRQREQRQCCSGEQEAISRPCQLQSLARREYKEEPQRLCLDQ